MKKLLLFFFLFFFIYLLSPYYSIYKFYKSVKNSDTEFVSKNVNWGSLKNNFKKDFKVILNKSFFEKKSKEEKILGNLLKSNSQQYTTKSRRQFIKI